MTKKKVSGRQKKKLQTMVLSLLLSIIVWFMVMSLTNPTISITLTNLNVRFIGETALREKQLAITGREDIPPLSITVRGSRTDLMNYMEDIYIQVDVSNIDAEGTYTLTGKTSMPTTRISVEKESYGGITVNAEELISKEMEVEVKQTGSPHGKLVSSVATNPKVVISGARSEIEEVDGAVATVDIANAQSGPVVVNYLLVNSSGALITGNETIESPRSEIEVINTVYNARALPVKPALNSTMAKIYDLDTERTEIERETVTVGLADGVDYDSVELVIDQSPENNGTEYLLKSEEGMYIPPEIVAITAKPVLRSKNSEIFTDGEGHTYDR